MPKSLDFFPKQICSKAAITIAAIAVLGFATVDSYGLSPDETVGLDMVKWNMEFVTKGKPFPVPEAFKYDGTVFNFGSELVFQAKKSLERLNGEKNLDRSPEESILARIKVKHPLTFLVSLLAYGATAGMVGILCGAEFAWVGMIVLCLIPMFWGHSFFNFKDIPYAAFFTVSTLSGAYLVNQYHQYCRTPHSRSMFKAVALGSLLYGILAGLATGIRISSFLVILFIPIAYFAASLDIKDSLRSSLKLIPAYLLVLLSWFITTTACYPTSWSNPIHWLVLAISSLSQYPWAGKVLFEGQYLSAQALPWYYIPQWLKITLPLITQFFFVLGLLLIFLKYLKFSTLQKACVILLLLQIFLLPVVAIVKGSTIYDGIRHFLFILPGIAAVAASGLIWLYQKIVDKQVRLFLVAIGCVFAMQVVFDMIALHPYEYVYFNRESGGLTSANNRYETDYWGLSLREATEWLNQNAEPGSKAVVGGPIWGARIFADPSFKMIQFADYNANFPKPYYFLAIPKHQMPKAFPECPVVHQVVRQKVPLAIVKQCQ
jgi:hypothetical protein